jgi:hypothetical protein
MGKSPNQSWVKGDPIRKSKEYFRPDSGCCFELPEMETVFLKDVNTAFLKEFGMYGDQLGAYLKLNNLSSKIFYWVQVDKGETPALVMDLDFLRFVHQTNAWVDLDLSIDWE